MTAIPKHSGELTWTRIGWFYDTKQASICLAQSPSLHKFVLIILMILHAELHSGHAHSGTCMAQHVSLCKRPGQWVRCLMISLQVAYLRDAIHGKCSSWLKEAQLSSNAGCSVVQAIASSPGSQKSSRCYYADRNKREWLSTSSPSSILEFEFVGFDVLKIQHGGNMETERSPPQLVWPVGGTGRLQTRPLQPGISPFEQGQ